MVRARRSLGALVVGVVAICVIVAARPVGAKAEGSTDALGAVAQRAVADWPARASAASAAAPAATSSSAADPLGDVVDEQGNQTVEPRADISAVDFTYAADHLDVTVTVPGGVDPTTSPNWQGNLSGVATLLDVNGDDHPDFGAVLVADENGGLQAGVFSIPPSSGSTAAANLRPCRASGSYDAASRAYRISVPSACIGNAYEARGGALLLFNRATSLSSALDITVDVAPNGNDPIAVHRDTAKNGAGYRFVARDGGIFSFGASSFLGSTGDIKLNRPIVGMESTRTGNGYWLVASDGGIFAFGDAPFLGSTGDLTLNQPVVAMAATPTGNGYWLAAKDGGIFAFGDAGFYGTPASPAPIVGIAATPDGGGYWLAAEDGTVTPFGDAADLGSRVAYAGNPVVGIAATPSGAGYWLAFANGDVVARGDAPYVGGAGSLSLSAPIVGVAGTPTGRGLWLVGRDGGVFSYGDANFYGSTGNLKLNQPVLGLAT